MDRRLVVRHDVDRDDRRRLSQGNRLSALREVPRLVRRAEEGSALPLPSHPTAGPCRPSDGGELPPVRAERHRVHTVGLASEDAVPCGCLGGQTPPGSESARRPYVTGRKKMGENCVASSVRASYHRIMTFRNSAKRDGYMKPCSQRELALSTRTVVT